jgi:hypothetical protein
VRLGTFKSDDKGNLKVSVKIPENTEPGFHTLHVYGPDIFGNELDMQDVVYVAASETDFDGDGIPNDQDACAIYPEISQDIDRDGVEDACDALIGEAPTDRAGDLEKNSSSPADIFSGDNGAAKVLHAAVAVTQRSITVFKNPFIKSSQTSSASSDFHRDSLNTGQGSGKVLGTDVGSKAPAQTLFQKATQGENRMHTFLIVYGVALLTAAYLLIRKWYAGGSD